MKLRVLIADDELLARQRLRRFLEMEPRIEVVAECVNGAETVKAIRETSPDVAFLDIKMPELDGFGVLKALDGIALPAIVFVTAHNEFATRAFDIHAVDYLVKPFDRERLQTALNRSRERLQGSAQAKTAASLTALMAHFRAGKPLDRLTVKSGARITLLKVAEIEWIGSADNYVELHVGSTTHLMRMTMSNLANDLSGNQFVRISRTVMVNLNCIKEIQPKSHGDFSVLLRTGPRLHGTRKYRANLALLLGR
jgi:two-component system, LytTR family, response regulator